MDWGRQILPRGRIPEDRAADAAKLGPVDYLFMPNLITALPDLFNWAKEHNIALDQRQQALFAGLLAKYDEWLERLNFTAIKEPREFVVKHFCDSLAPLLEFDFKPAANLLDLGSGGGLPGIPLGIMLPHLPVTLLEATKKKEKMLAEIIAALAFGNIRVIQGRAEELAHNPGMRATFDLVTARAFGDWPMLLELALPFLRVGGRLLAYQGPAIVDKLKEHDQQLEQLGGSLKSLHAYTLP